MTATLTLNTGKSFSFKLNDLDERKYHLLDQNTIMGRVFTSVFILAFISVFVVSTQENATNYGYLLSLIGLFIGLNLVGLVTVNVCVPLLNKKRVIYRNTLVPDVISAFEQAGFLLYEEDALKLVQKSEDSYAYFTDNDDLRYRVVWMRFERTKTSSSFTVDYFLDDPEIERRKQAGRLKEIAKEGFSEWFKDNPGVYSEEFVNGFTAGFMSQRN